LEGDEKSPDSTAGSFAEAWNRGIDGFQMYRIASKSRAVLETPKALFFSQYLCGTAKPDTSHVTFEIYLADRFGNLHSAIAFIDCGAD